MVRDALQLGLSASWFAGDEVYSGRRHRRSYRELGRCYAVAVKTDHVITCGFGKRWEARHAINKVRPEQWQRMRTGTAPRAPASTTGSGPTSARTTPPTDMRTDSPCWSLFSMIATVVLALTLAEAMAKAGTPATVAGITLVPLSSPELVRILRDFVLPEQPRDQAYKRWWRTWRRRHQAIQLSASGGC